MYAKRLLKLANLLEKDAKRKNGIKFDYGDWGTVRNPAKPLSCGTTACAMGLAALSGAFKRQGLEIELKGKGFYFIVGGNYRDALEAAAEVFGLLYYQAAYLFLPQKNNLQKGARAERAVAKKIRQFVKGHQ